MMGNDYKKYLEAKGFTKRSIESYYRTLGYYLGWCEDQQLNAPYSSYTNIIQYIKYLQSRGIKQITIQKYLTSLNHYFKQLSKKDFAIENPIPRINLKGIKRRSLHHILSTSELEDLYLQYHPNDSSIRNLLYKSHKERKGRFQKNYWVQNRNKVIIGLMVYQGLGTKELNGLCINNINIQKGIVLIRGSKKSNERILPLNALQKPVLMEYFNRDRKKLLEIAQKESRKLFISMGSSTNLNNSLQKLLPQIKALNPNVRNLFQIRASVITHWLTKFNLREVQYMAGHRYVSSTESYIAHQTEDLKKDIERYHPF